MGFPACLATGAHGGGGAAAPAARALDAGCAGPARPRRGGRRRVAAARTGRAGGRGGGAALHGGAPDRPQLRRVRAALRLLQTRHLAGAHGQLEVPGPVLPPKAAGLVWGQRGPLEHCQHLLLPESPFPAVDLPFQDYVEHLLHPQDPASLGNDTLYFFGDNNFTEWASLFRHYSPPPFGLLGTTPAYSFGIAGAGSGVPFHWHGPGFSEVIYGRKRWFLYPPEKTPEFHPNKTTLAWLRDTYPTLAPSARPLECTIQAGEVLYFPDRWWHATLNLDTSVFISTFLS
uniref:Jumonji domain containing 8 n=1 Tax=Equus caballus TaxID=9796 RepID=A0A5F5PV48_HORSE